MGQLCTCDGDEKVMIRNRCDQIPHPAQDSQTGKENNEDSTKYKTAQEDSSPSRWLPNCSKQSEPENGRTMTINSRINLFLITFGILLCVLGLGLGTLA